MFRGYGTPIKIFLLLLVIGTLAHAADTIKLKKALFDIVKKCSAIDDMVEGVGGYECARKIKPIQLPGISVGTFNELLSILYAAKITLNVNDMSLVEDGILQPTIEQILKSRDSQQLLDLMTMANYLDVKPIVLGSAKVWSQKYAVVKSSFKYLNNDLKKIIIKELSPSEFIALVEANDNLDQLAKEEVFRMALKIHHDKEPEMGKSAQELYEELPRLSKVERLVGRTVLRKAPLDKPLGITLRQLHVDDYQPRSAILVLRKGRVWVLADKVNAPGDSTELYSWPILIRDTRGITVFADTQAWIQKMPQSTLGQKLGNREWKIRVARLEAVVG